MLVQRSCLCLRNRYCRPAYEKHRVLGMSISALGIALYVLDYRLLPFPSRTTQQIEQLSDGDGFLESLGHRFSYSAMICGVLTIYSALA